jgi:hypothetical protein
MRVRMSLILIALGECTLHTFHTVVRRHEDCCVVTVVDVHMFSKQKSCCRHFRSKISRLKDYN